ncbi:Methyltransferase small domain-containing protein [Thiothrix eikelboomii]|uniref:Methyltransferase small domain-containing protein n=1 Tax=Thiothrix eikelboomii TaxID=92487 RepID=A0A1T4XGR5_9GAMM|nr:methyltransferase [Thiothrix eikelboomii]SKA88756.1 Methyltransferase small domain-containing protein [Thiothrix eikelboomii]
MTDSNYLREIRQDIRFEAELCGQTFSFLSTWGIFSPREIDEGTELLLKYIEINPTDDCFDLGCGYGPVGLAMAKLAPQGKTLMVDKDFMAVEYSNRNAQLNKLANAQAMLSNGFQHIDPSLRFDVIASNIPAKVGKEMMTILLQDMNKHLKPGGRIYLVTINGLREYMKRNLQEVFGNYSKLKQGKNYTIAYSERR